jgi:hypothetical protein
MRLASDADARENAGQRGLEEGDTMLLERDRARLLRVLESRSASHAERREAKELLEEDRAVREADGEGEGSETFRRRAVDEAGHRQPSLGRAGGLTATS